MADQACTLMRRLQSASFAVDELKLYLDTHPDDPNALECYCRMKTAREKAARQYVEAIGPLTAEEVPCGQHWTWTDRPWPWEGGC